MRFWLRSTKMVSTTLSDDITSARIPNGKGSKGFRPGIKLRLIALQARTSRICNKRKATLPMNLAMASLIRSAVVRRSSASCSSFAMASMLYWVGLLLALSGKGFGIWDPISRLEGTEGTFYATAAPGGRGWRDPEPNEQRHHLK